MKAVALDDEPVSLSIIQSFAKEVPFLSLEKTFTETSDAACYFAANTADLLFLDIRMPDISGIDFFQSLANKPMLIFTTAFMEHAVRSYELEAIDYLLKPFSRERFQKACMKARDFTELKNDPTLKSLPFIFVKSGYEQIKIHLEEIVYIESSGNYVHFVLQDKKILSRLTMQEVINLLSPNFFIRTHRSFLIAKAKITRIEKNRVHAGKHAIPVGNMYAENLHALYR
ncbi:response regulator transcription factor [Dyadobacter luticola]|uniref:Response regulator transcription factor n=1 Tax=Dyadobacter luticola TaxID=1979387 RepID=A0A5R9KM56_9BACT|nr:response regulator transcription factor [Dyadobacter luticola]